jgi:hypothetical protein
MTDQYLWDRTGEFDPDVAELERLLSPLAHDGRPLVLPASARVPRTALAVRQVVPMLALAATVVLIVAGIWTNPGRPSGASTVEPLEGAVRLGSRQIGAREPIQPGDRVLTGAGGRAQLVFEGVGTVNIGARTRLRVVRTRPGSLRLILESGNLDATISAPPGIFLVDTPASRAVDLGCKYTLDVDAGGAGLLRVTTGWVGLQWKGRESLVPAGAICATRAAKGPGTPYFDGAAPEFIGAVSSLDHEAGGDRAAAVTALIEHARPLDSLTLWHLLTRLDQASAGRVYDRLAMLMPPPARVARARVLAGDPAMLAAWWHALGLGDLEELRAGLRGSYR